MLCGETIGRRKIAKGERGHLGKGRHPMHPKPDCEVKEIVRKIFEVHKKEVDGLDSTNRTDQTGEMKLDFRPAGQTSLTNHAGGIELDLIDAAHEGTVQNHA